MVCFGSNSPGLNLNYLVIVFKVNFVFVKNMYTAYYTVGLRRSRTTGVHGQRWSLAILVQNCQ